MSWFEKATTPGGQDVSKSLAVERRNQETNMWCWAASGEMVMDYLGVNVTQCDQANKRLGKSNCCMSPVPNDCVQGGWPEFDKFGFTFAKTNSTPLTWEQIVEQIDVLKAPFAFTWAWTGGGGHMMVIYGYAEIGGIRYVMVHDPWPPGVGATRTITYDDYVSGPDYSHWDDYYDVEKVISSPFGSVGGPGNMNEQIPGQREVVEASRDEAVRSLAAMRQLLKASGPGAGSGTMTLGSPITVSVIRLDELRATNLPSPGTEDGSVSELLRRKPTKVVYPVLDDRMLAQAEIVVVQHGKTWRQGSMGSPSLTARTKSSVNAPGGSENTNSTAVILVPSLNQEFLIITESGDTRYRPLINDPQLGFDSKQPLTANELTNKLIAAAKAHNGLPR